ncbi:hypothetical protein GCM10009654_38410 [Streptomyces hebeiensis]|uniref:Sortase n=1 Tax=Streptomyces hebeiensis TaxID=229486 RepID=A0ABP4FGP2_9ACTN
MRPSLLALRAATAVTVLVSTPVLGTATAEAITRTADPVTVMVIPSSAAPGQRIEIRASGCAGTSAVARSDAFVADVDLAPRAYGEDWIRDQEELARNPKYKIPLTGLARLRSSVTPGQHQIVISCGGGRVRSGSGTFEVVRRAAARPEAHASPTAPVRAGGGGTAKLTADRHDDEAGVADSSEPGDSGDSTNPNTSAGSDTSATASAQARGSAATGGPGTRHAVIGLVLTGVAAVAVAFRGVRRQRGAAGPAARDTD